MQMRLHNEEYLVWDKPVYLREFLRVPPLHGIHIHGLVSKNHLKDTIRTFRTVSDPRLSGIPITIKGLYKYMKIVGYL